METAAVSLEAAPLQELRGCLSSGRSPELEPWLASIQAMGLAEEAWELLRGARRNGQGEVSPGGPDQGLAELAARSLERRAALHHLDSRRCTVRFRFRKGGDSLCFDAGDVQTLFLQAFRLEGVPLDLDLGRRPRPLLRVACPLPSGVAGCSEILEAVLRQSPREPWRDWLDRLNRRLPAGLELLEAEQFPLHASPAADLAETSLWQWPCPAALKGPVVEKLEAFLRCTSFPLVRGDGGTIPGLDLRLFATEFHWEGEALCFTTRMGAGQATNPLKVLGAVLGLGIGEMADLTRRRIVLKPDSRLAKAEKYEPKLKNIYEDAVLLSGGSNIVLVEEDDDELLLSPLPESHTRSDEQHRGHKGL